MKPTYLFLFLVFFLSSFHSEKAVPEFKLIISSADCFFDVTINDQYIYSNRNSYQVNRTLKIEKYLEKKDSQKLYFQIFPTTHKKTLTNKSKLNLIVLKELNGKSDTIKKLISTEPGFEVEGKTIYASTKSSTHYFKTN